MGEKGRQEMRSGYCEGVEHQIYGCLGGRFCCARAYGTIIFGRKFDKSWFVAFIAHAQDLVNPVPHLPHL